MSFALALGNEAGLVSPPMASGLSQGACAPGAKIHPKNALFWGLSLGKGLKQCSFSLSTRADFVFWSGGKNLGWAIGHEGPHDGPLFFEKGLPFPG